MPLSSTAKFEKWLKGKLTAIPEVTACVGNKVFNSVNRQKSKFPVLTYKVIPLDNTVGNGKLAVQKQSYCDIQIYAEMPHDPDSVDVATEAIENYFNTTNNHIYDGVSIAIRPYRPISRVIPGATAAENIIARGETYKVWISKAE